MDLAVIVPVGVVLIAAWAVVNAVRTLARALRQRRRQPAGAGPEPPPGPPPGLDAASTLRAALTLAIAPPAVAGLVYLFTRPEPGPAMAEAVPVFFIGLGGASVVYGAVEAILAVRARRWSWDHGLVLVVGPVFLILGLIWLRDSPW